jgi:hypothetical protein
MSFRWSLLLVAAIAAGCYTGSAVDNNNVPGDPTVATDGTQPVAGPGSNVHGLTHLPCDVEKLFEANCWSCHGTVPGFGAKTTLVYHDDIAKDSDAIPGMKEGDICVIRMGATEDTMPPAPDGPLPADQVAILQNWLNAGAPIGHCGETADAGADGSASGPTDVSNAPSVCTSGKTIDSSSHHTALTDPGASCASCHDSSSNHPLTVGGTIYPTPNEPDGCAGTTGMSVVLLDANGATHTLTANANGNFSSTDDIAFPAHVVVNNAGTIREMQAPVASGDCNGCHAASPKAGDAGRVTP